MRIILRLALVAIVVLGVLRTLMFVMYAIAEIPSPFETFHLEGKMVLLAYRAQMGLPLYPPWHDYPYVANIFSPVYFVLTGLLGRLVNADIRSLYTVGRLVTLSTSLLTVIGTVVYAHKRYGLAAALAGATVGLGSIPMIGFGVMVRPDALAETFGFAGFLAALSRNRYWRIAGCLLLVLSAMSKQTSAIFLVATVLTLVLERRWRDAVLLSVGFTATILAIVSFVTTVREPQFASCLMAVSNNAWSLAAWFRTLRQCATLSPDIFYFTVLGLILWLTLRPKDLRLATLSAVLLFCGLLTSAKVGSDLNYYLNLHVIEILAVATLWRHAPAVTNRNGQALLALATLLGALLFYQSLNIMTVQALKSTQVANYYKTSAGRRVWGSYERLISVAENPKFRILTDLSFLESFQGDRAAFGDPWYFRILVDTGEIRPKPIENWIDTEAYDAVMTKNDLLTDEYANYESGLPMSLVPRIREHYVPAKKEGDVFIYVKRGVPVPASTAPGRP